MIIGDNGNENIQIDLPTLQETRLLIQANSGAGKSWTLRKIIEILFGKIQIIILDPEGEFHSLRPHFDFILAGKNHDIPVSVKTASMLAEKLMEHEVSAVIDLYDLKVPNRKQFVKIFVESLMSLPKKYYHPVLIVMDEAHIFCPEKGQSESFSAVEDLLVRGRKRGYCTIMATQRMAMLNKNVTAQLINLAIGRTTQDIDQRRCADQLGLIGKSAAFDLGKLEPGHFKIIGPAWRIDGKPLEKVEDISIGRVISKHPRIGSKTNFKPTKANPRIIKALSKIGDIPKEAEQKAKTIQEMTTEIRNLKLELSRKEKPCNHQPVIDKLNLEISNLINRSNKQGEMLSEISDYMKHFLSGDIEKYMQPISLKTLNMGFKADCDKFHGLPKHTPKIFPLEIDREKYLKTAKNNHVGEALEEVSFKINKGARRILITLANRLGMKTSKAQLATLSKFRKSSGTYNTYLSTLKTVSFIEVANNSYHITDDGLGFIGHEAIKPKSTEEIQNDWRDKLSGACKTMFNLIIEAGMNGINKYELAEAAGIKYGTGTWGTYLSTLQTNDLIAVTGDIITINPIIIGIDNG